VLKLVQRAWREGYFGLAAVIAVGWDTMLSPVDVRTLTKKQRREDEHGRLFFETKRAKTDEEVLGTLTRCSQAVLNAYLAKLGMELHESRAVVLEPRGRVRPQRWQAMAAAALHQGGSAERGFPPRPYAGFFGPADERQLQDTGAHALARPRLVTSI
jgi:hypothetical protein